MSDEGRDHVLRPEWLTAEDPMPLRSAGTRQKWESLARRMIAANAIRRYREDGDDGRVSYSRRESWYSDHDRRFYWPGWFSYTYILSAVAQLEADGLLGHDKKPPGNRHWQSWFRATEKLMGFKTKLQHTPMRRIILRDEDKNDIAYNDKARPVLKMDRDIDAINAYLAKQTIALGGKILKEGDPLYIDLHCVSGATRIQLRRIFNDRSWLKGGRWYNDLQNIPKSARHWMTISGYPVAVHDYSAFYPGLLYAMVGAACDGDPYTIPGWSRELAKPILNILINAKTGTSAVRAAAGELKNHLGGSQNERYAKARLIIAALKERNQPVAGFFHSDAGKRLMWFESFVLDNNMRDLMRLEIPFVPLHDALLVPEPAYQELKSIMNRNLDIAKELMSEAHFQRQNEGPNLDSVSVASPTG
jgi:hypothetical protein